MAKSGWDVLSKVRYEAGVRRAAWVTIMQDTGVMSLSLPRAG